MPPPSGWMYAASPPLCPSDIESRFTSLCAHERLHRWFNRFSAPGTESIMQFDHQAPHASQPSGVLEHLLLSTFDIDLGQIDSGNAHLSHERVHCNRPNFSARALLSDESPFSTGPGSRIWLPDIDLSVSIPESCMNRDDCRVGPNVPGEYGEVRGLRFYRKNFGFRVSMGEVYRCHTDVSPGINDCFRRKRQVKGV